MARVALIGLGRMGSGMAGRLLAAGHDLVVANRTPQRAAPLVAAGARLAATPAEAARGADAVFAMVSDDAASREVWLGDDGVLSGPPRPGAFAVECSTLSHEWVLDLAAATRAAGLRYLDAPVTGLPDAAAEGRLTLLVGADPVTFADVLATGQAASPQVVRNLRRMVAGDHDQEITFSGDLRRKDTAYALGFARGLGIAAPLGDVALTGLDRLVAEGAGNLNESALIEVARRASPAG